LSSAELSAERLHELAVQAFRTGNRGRLSLCEALRVLSETRLYYDLGFPSLPAYADAFFQLRRAEAFEYVRVSNALVELQELREAFGGGAIGWSALKAITRVASIESQSTWVEFARKNGVVRTLAEARDALQNRREAPRDGSFGLPNLDQRLVLRFSRSDMEKVRKWLDGGCAAAAESTGAEEVSLEQAILETQPRRPAAAGQHGGPAVADQHRIAYRAQIVYQSCPDCSRARLGTRDGFVEVAPEELDRYMGSAETVEIDGPTPPRLRRQLLAREAGHCGNPRCGNPADHCHHIVFRSQGGKTDLANEVAVCTVCHALVHAGLLRVSGRADTGLHWSPVACNSSIGRDVAAGQNRADRLPVLRLVSATPATSRTSRTLATSATGAPIESEAQSAGGAQSAIADSDYETVNRDDLAHGLKRLGVPAGRSRQLIDAAIASLPRGETTEESVLRAAIRAF